MSNLDVSLDELIKKNKTKWNTGKSSKGPKGKSGLKISRHNVNTGVPQLIISGVTKEAR